MVIADKCVVTPSARDFLAQHNIALVNGRKEALAAPAASARLWQQQRAADARQSQSEVVFYAGSRSHQERDLRGGAQAVDAPVCRRQRRQHLVSHRTQRSHLHAHARQQIRSDARRSEHGRSGGKSDCRNRPRTSEIFLHLEIYKAVPEAKSCVHCHPPHATAYAITGRVPPNLVIPEFEVFVGKVAISPYETPGTAEFARPFCPTSRRTTRCCWPITASSAGQTQ